MNPFIEARKALVAIASGVGELAALGLLDGAPLMWVSGVLASLNAALVFYVPNGKTIPPPDDIDAFNELLHLNEVQHFGANSVGAHELPPA